MTRLRAGIIAAAAGAALVVVAGGAPAVVLQFLLDKIAYGTSNAATLFALAVVAVMAAGVPTRSASWWRNTAFVAAGTGFGIHTVIAVRWLRSNSIPLDAMVVAWRDGSNSFTSWQHSHVGKAGLAAMSSWIGGTGARYDTGTVFLGDVPPIVAGALGACLVVAVIGTVGWYSAWQRQTGAGWRWPHHVLFTTAAVVTLKTQLDGGIAAHGAMASCLVLASFGLAADAAAFERFWRRRGAAGLLAVTVLQGMWAWTCGGGAAPHMGAELFYTAFYSCLLLLTSARPRLWIPAALGVYLVTNLWVDVESRLLPVLLPLPAGSHELVVAGDGARIALDRPAAADSAWTAFERAGEDPRKPRRTLLAAPDAAGIRRIEVSVRPRSLAATGTVAQPVDGAWQVSGIAVEGGALQLRIELQDERLPPFIGIDGGAVAHHNLQVYLHWIAARLRTAGMSDFLLVLRRQ